MGESLANSLPWSEQDDEEATSSEMTPGGTESTQWVVVAANLNPAEAAIIKGRLESRNILATIQQEAIGIVLGLTVGSLGSAKVLVPEPLAEQALAILAETFEDDEGEQGDE
jgi:hypothetical protein